MLGRVRSGAADLVFVGDLDQSRDWIVLRGVSYIPCQELREEILSCCEVPPVMPRRSGGGLSLMRCGVDPVLRV